jgi:hypothetical protein
VPSSPRSPRRRRGYRASGRCPHKSPRSRSPDSRLKDRASPSAVTARLALRRRAHARIAPHAKRHIGQRQFHCGKPPPAAEPNRRAVNRPIQDRMGGSELGWQIPVDLEADTDLNERRGCPGHSSFSLAFPGTSNLDRAWPPRKCPPHWGVEHRRLRLIILHKPMGLPLVYLVVVIPNRCACQRR